MDKTDIASIILKRMKGEVDKDIDIYKTVKENLEKTPEGKAQHVKNINTEKQKRYYTRKNKAGQYYINVFIKDEILDLLHEDMVNKDCNRSIALDDILREYYIKEKRLSKD